MNIPECCLILVVVFFEAGLSCAVRDTPLEVSKVRIIKPVHSYKSHVTSPFQVFWSRPPGILGIFGGHDRVTSTNLTIQHVKYVLFSPRVALLTTRMPLKEALLVEQLLRRNVNRFRGGLVLKAHRLVYHSTLGLRVIKKEKKHC